MFTTDRCVGPALGNIHKYRLHLHLKMKVVGQESWNVVADMAFLVGTSHKFKGG